MYISVTLIAMNDLTDDIFRTKRKLKFQLVLWASSSHIMVFRTVQHNETDKNGYFAGTGQRTGQARTNCGQLSEICLTVRCKLESVQVSIHFCCLLLYYVPILSYLSVGILVVVSFQRTSAPELSAPQLISPGGGIHPLSSTKWFWVFASAGVVLSFFRGLFFIIGCFVIKSDLEVLR